MKSHKILTIFIGLVILVGMIGIFLALSPTIERSIGELKARLASDTGEQAHVGKFAGGDPDQQQQSSATTPGEGPAGGFEAYLAAQRTYPADEIPPAVSAQAALTFDAIAATGRARQGDPNSKGHKWAQVGPLNNATQPGVTAFSGATNNTASRTTALLVDPKCGSNGQRCSLPRLGWHVRRRRLEDRQRARRQPEVESAQATGSRPEHGRRAEHGPDRQDGQHDLSRHRRAEPLLVRLRGRRRHLQVDRRRQQLEEAR